ncbi:MAG: hypothetical protein AAF085_09035 [Planctomycetota bacterium]
MPAKLLWFLRGLGKALISFCVIWCLVYSVVYVLPKAIKSSYPDLMPLSYGYWDRGNLELALALSFMTAWFGIYAWMRPRTPMSGNCSNCGYDLRGLPEDESGHRICPECGHVNHSDIEA